MNFKMFVGIKVVVFWGYFFYRDWVRGFFGFGRVFWFGGGGYWSLEN